MTSHASLPVASLAIALRAVVSLPDDEVDPGSMVTEENLADPDTGIDAAMEYALELNRLIELQMEGSVG